MLSPWRNRLIKIIYCIFFVISSDNEGNKSTGRAINEDIVMASILAVLDSINKLLLIKRT